MIPLRAFLAPGRRFGVLMVSLGLLAFLPFVLPQRLASVLVPLLFTVVLLSALAAVSETRARFLLGAPFAVVGVVLSTLRPFVELPAIDIAANAALLVFLAVVVVMIVSFVLRARAVDLGIVLGAVCAYLILAVMWGVAYELLHDLAPTAFSIPAAAQERGATPLMYFSFVTITTLGYGDITPVSGSARMLSLLEAVIGQLFLVVLVARLVGLHTTYEARRLNESSHD